MDTATTTYRIWFRGKALVRVPQYVVRNFVDADEAEEWAIREIHRRNDGVDKATRFNRISIHVVEGKLVHTEPIREVMFGAG